MFRLYNSAIIRSYLNVCRNIFIAALLFSGVTSAGISEHQRDLFRLAVQALQAGDFENFRLITARNKDYLLYPYLKFYGLKAKIATVDEVEVEEFIKSYSNMPLGARLEASWIRELAKSKRWDEFIQRYNNRGGRRLQCQFLYAKYQRANLKKDRLTIIRKSKKIWMSGKSQPTQCTPLFKILYSKKLISTKMLWQRIDKAMDRRNIKLAKSLSKRLNHKGKKIVDGWIYNGKNPENLLKTQILANNTGKIREIILQILNRYARQDAGKARLLWSKLRKKYSFSHNAQRRTERYIALRSSYQLHPTAYQWLSEIKPKWVDDSTRIWRARAALRIQDWKAVEKCIRALSDNDRADARWRYWYARAIEKLGRLEEAKKTYEALSLRTDYYGFLAADRIGADYTFANEPLESNPRRLSLLETVPGISRSKELYLVGRLTDARREWNYVMRSFDEPKIKLAAVMAYNWQWYDNAIVTVARTGHRADYKLRFPTPHKDTFQVYAQTYGIDISWMYGVARRESAFKVDARSRVGALGLMQLMPGTARLQSRQLGINKPKMSDLLQPESNIKLGGAYLHQMLLRFEGSQAIATAAYNAGPARVRKWIPSKSGMPIDVWVDTVPYKETREYVRAV
ncbi:MAG: transglycosylase SLT domain-containing protein, partial [Thiohalomonadales bacterium]